MLSIIIDNTHLFYVIIEGNKTIRPPWNPPTEPTGEAAPKFTRGMSAGSSNAAVPPGFTPGDDVIAPGRIIDLRVTMTSFDNATVTLAWLATGDDLDSGRGESLQFLTTRMCRQGQLSFNIPNKKDTLI